MTNPVLTREAQNRLQTYLDAVSAAMTAGGEGSDAIAFTQDSLRDQVLEIAGTFLGDNEGPGAIGEAAMRAALAHLDPPEAFQAADRSPEGPVVMRFISSSLNNPPVTLGVASTVLMLVSVIIGFVLPAIASETRDPAGAVFLFGELLALAMGLAAWPNRWGRFGVFGASALILLLIVVFVWQAVIHP